jgi:hypothetical protein
MMIKKFGILSIIITSVIIGIIFLNFLSTDTISITTDNPHVDILDVEFGEYSSLGNIWIEITHSVANPVPWAVAFYLDDMEEQFEIDWSDVSSEKQAIEWFYEQYDIKVLDVIKSSKHIQMCEAIGCISGTYHILISNEDHEKFKTMSFGFIEFGDSGMIEPNVAGYIEHRATWKAEKILLSHTGNLELKLQLYYDLEIPEYAEYYCDDCYDPIRITKDLYFVDSVVFFTYPHGGYSNNKVLGIIAGSKSPKEASIDYSGNLEFSEPTPYHYNFGSIGFGWVRILEDSDGERYYQWMRSTDSTRIKLNSSHTVNGEFSISSPYPEFASNTHFIFDYVSWIKKNMYSDES